jgi:serine/threonine protein kinase
LSRQQYDSILKEAEILQQLNHPNIVKFIKVIETEKRILLVMELIRGGQLKSLVKERVAENNPINDLEASIIMKHIFSALECIQGKEIVHRDLKLGIF